MVPQPVLVVEVQLAYEHSDMSSNPEQEQELITLGTV